ncbi:transposase [Streptomyces sp. NPDC088337]|uniref:transposase n=2 Tax=Streptomyces TaxID=1883 RepID=UPI002DD9273A|nr:transposase [Streptomyces sp. NBC_01788]WSB30831.1 transposase [Streptomyces sp. NBC_01788]
MIDAVRYLVDNGIKWRATPSDFPPWPRVYAFFGRWRDTGLVAELHDLLREVVREAEGRGACWSRRPPRPAGTPPLISVLQS